MTTTSSDLQHSAGPLAQVQDYFTAFGCGDIDGALKLMTEDVVWHVDGVQSVSTVGLLRGRDQVRGWLESFPGYFRPREFSVDQLLESGDTVSGRCCLGSALQRLWCVAKRMVQHLRH